MDHPDGSLTWVMVRHGETEWTEARRIHGRLDRPLSERGRWQASRAAKRLSGQAFDALYTSAQGRAMETAATLGRAVGLTPRPLEGLQEYDFGWLEGMPLPAFSPAYIGPRTLRPIVHMMMRLSAEGDRRFSRRVRGALDELVARHPVGRVLIVTHWVVLSQTLIELVAGNGANWREYGPWAACGLTELRRTGGRWSLVAANDAQHLQRDDGEMRPG
jgi:broad specificity phosphatase PhoE